MHYAREAADLASKGNDGEEALGSLVVPAIEVIHDALQGRAALAWGGARRGGAALVFCHWLDSKQLLLFPPLPKMQQTAKGTGVSGYEKQNCTQGQGKASLPAPRCGTCHVVILNERMGFFKQHLSCHDLRVTNEGRLLTSCLQASTHVDPTKNQTTPINGKGQLAFCVLGSSSSCCTQSTSL